ncbi:hypothetical protein JG687_00003095 [Phytophthora cactorum]|uniref:Uncharacterized protein n=1 Tax=Phytophthora cactorum TaxID=29920 RepID=A0A8T1USI3_9STRA|nr:hypothetical protein JG687_00003095 [Phytophthora cactorum]
MPTADDMTASMDSVPSVVDPSGSSDQSQNVSFSGPSFLSSTDFMPEGPQAHIPGPCPMAMIDQHSVATADPYFLCLGSRCCFSGADSAATIIARSCPQLVAGTSSAA